MSSCLYVSEVMHQRKRPFTYRFRYPALHCKIDIDRFEQEAAQLKKCGFNRFNWVSLHTKDFGARDPAISWRSWIEKLLAQYGHTDAPDRVELVCAPRILGVIFNPLAVWYAYNASGQLTAIIGEVSNTFGQYHHYVLTRQGRPLTETQTQTIHAQAPKVFHVSPFLSMDCRYRFRFQAPGAFYKLGIYQSENQKPTLIATQVSKAWALNDAHLEQMLRRFGIDTLRTLWRIHLWAFKIWRRGGRFHRTPKALIKVPYSHSAMQWLPTSKADPAPHNGITDARASA